MPPENSMQGVEQALVTIAQAIKGGAQDGQNFATAEIDTGAKWIDGKSIFKQTFQFNLIASSSEQIVDLSLTTAVTRVIKLEGGLWIAGAQPEFYPMEYVNPAASTLQNMQTKLSFISSGTPRWQIRCNSGAAGSHATTIYFTK